MANLVQFSWSNGAVFLTALCLAQLSFSSLGYSNCGLPKLRQAMKFDKARSTLLDAGWQGVRKYPLPERSGMVGHVFYDLGYSEVVDCAGTGVSPCVFLYINANGKKLEVHTFGEEKLVLDTWQLVK